MDNFEKAVDTLLKTLQAENGIPVVSVYRVPKCESVRVLHVKWPNHGLVKYVVKIPYVGSMDVNPEWTRLLWNEICIQGLIRDLGHTHKNYFLYDLSSPKPQECYAISNYIEGVTLDEVGQSALVPITQVLLDSLYNIHSRTISEKFGYLHGNYRGILFSSLETRYLLSDIARDGICLGMKASHGLSMCSEALDQQRVFCLCHCDITMRNVLWDCNEPCLIDWAFARWSHPAHDLAHVFFWLIEYGQWQIMAAEYARQVGKYEASGFTFSSVFAYYLAQRYIEFGRIRGRGYIDKGVEILESVSSGVDLIDSLARSKKIKG